MTLFYESYIREYIGHMHCRSNQRNYGSEVLADGVGIST